MRQPAPLRAARRPRADADHRRAQIVAAALECFVERGYQATTIEDIRRASGASIGSIYHHYGSKEGVAAALYLSSLAAYQAELRDRAHRARTARAFVRGIVFCHIDWTVENAARARFLIEMRRAEAGAAIRAEVREMNAALLGDLGQRAAAFAARGAIIEMPLSLYNAILVGPAQQYLKSWLAGRASVAPAAARGPLADAAWAALKAR